MKFYLFGLIILTFPILAASAYDVETLKKNIANIEALKITAWKVDAKSDGWRSVTVHKSTSVTVGKKKTELIAPFINPPQKKVARELCTEFAVQSLGISSKGDLERMAKIIKDSTRKHEIKFGKFSGMTFYVLPKLVGMRVSLHCSIKPKR